MKPYYQDDYATIYCGDCLEVMQTLPSSSVDLVITSPPYNLGEGMEDKGGLRIGQTGGKWKRQIINGQFSIGYNQHTDDLPYSEYKEWQKSILNECWRLLDDGGAIFYNHKPRVVKGSVRLPFFHDDNLNLRQVVTWFRGSGFQCMDGAYMPTCEWILLYAKPNFQLRDKAASGVGDVWRITPAVNNPHPAPFPIQLPKQILSTTDAKTVLDPFMGSGTTLRAAKDLGRKAIGIELDESYCEMAAKRLSQEVLAFV